MNGLKRGAGRGMPCFNPLTLIQNDNNKTVTVIMLTLSDL
jgi:hypothetical protein